MALAVSADSAKRALFERLIDDAGLFPPAELPMRVALRHHLRHRESAYRWVTGRFVVPASRIDEFIAARAAESAPVELSVILDAGMLGAKGDTVRADLHRIERAASISGVIGVVARSAVAERAARRRGAAAHRRGCARALSVRGRRVLVRVDVRRRLAHAAGRVAAGARRARASAPAHVTLGAKVRCGGTASDATPTVDDLAAFIVAAHAHDVPWKASAGLHHPIRGVADDNGTAAHGFLNVFLAGIALHAGAMEPSRVADMLADDDREAFVVDPTHAAWRDVRVEAAAIAAARARCVAFGSCSFAEPVNDLRELGILL